jgi:hypothetical protein
MSANTVPAVVAVCPRCVVMRPPVPPVLKMPAGLVGAGAREPLGVVDVELSLRPQHRGAHVGDVANRVETCQASAQDRRVKINWYVEATADPVPTDIARSACSCVTLRIRRPCR